MKPEEALAIIIIILKQVKFTWDDFEKVKLAVSTLDDLIKKSKEK